MEKINKINISLTKLIKKNREETQANKIGDEKEVTRDTTEIQRIIRDYYDQYAVFSISSWFRLGRLFFSKNFSISFRLSIFWGRGARIYNGEKGVSSKSSAGKTGWLHVKE